MSAQLDTVREACRTDAVVTDVASTKRSICDHATATWPRPRRFVGSHPMAGSEKFGAIHSDTDLYDGAIVLVERGDTVDVGAHKTVIQLWESLGSTVVGIEPEKHDQFVARTSHVPHIVASALAQLTDLGSGMAPFIGKGFRDSTRIAEGRPEIWRDICLTNPHAIDEGLSDLIRRLEGLRHSLSAGESEELDRFFEQGLHARREILES